MKKWESYDYSTIDPNNFVIKKKRVYYFFKRVFDFFGALVALILLSWLLLIIAILVKCTSEGPIIYASDRVGKNGKVFKFYKFRTMVVDAESQLEDLLKHNETGGVTFKMKNDPRITKFGKFLRKTSLDELPQLWNIVKGNMSFVGPRPCTTREYNLYSEKDKLRLLVPQGLTGYWQIHGRSNTTFDDMVNMDIFYIIKRRGFFYDFWLMVRTVLHVFQKDGAE